MMNINFSFLNINPYCLSDLAPSNQEACRFQDIVPICFGISLMTGVAVILAKQLTKFSFADSKIQQIAKKQLPEILSPSKQSNGEELHDEAFNPFDGTNKFFSTLADIPEEEEQSDL